MYKSILKPLFFQMQPEKAHHLIHKFLKTTFSLPGIAPIIRNNFLVESPALETEVFGIKFPNRVGLAAGFDKDGKMFNELASFGFGFIEIGTVTPRPQPGNPEPRLFRLLKDEAIINRMGFNNDGVKKAAERLRNRKSNIIIGGNIGKNKDTPNEKAFEDYKICFEELFELVDYFVVNVSSPNTPGLRALQEKGPLTEILNALQNLNKAKPAPKPILLKIAPDLTHSQLDDIVDIVKETGIAGVIATNTTIDRSNLTTEEKEVEGIGAGGLSGKPLTSKSTEIISYLSEKSAKAFPIIGVGGIHSPEDAIEKLNAGASLVQLYTGFIYEGPGLVKRINKALLKWKQ
ncbi:MAG: quinone-dependent dihydroorotate dehydrogenase [Bacteroidetes bacterium]|nr:quinone-dependent dihydroorotate dehydrogenase [Bacteroidota bacterium]